MKTASWRGATFEIEDTNDELGARNVVHEYPGRAATSESTGKFPRRFTLTGHLIGKGYEARLRKLEAALDEEGPGTLVHPTRGSVTVSLEGPANIRETTLELGMARVTMTFVVEGESNSPVPSVDTSRSLTDRASELLGSLRLGTLDMSGLNFIQKAAAAILAGPKSLTANMRAINARMKSTIGIVTDASQAIDDFSAAANELLNQPDSLAIAMQGLMNSTLGGITSVERNLVGGDRQSNGAIVSLGLANMVALSYFGDGLDVVRGSTPAREQQRENQNALVDTIEVSAIAISLAALVQLPFDSHASVTDSLDALTRANERIHLRGTLDPNALRMLAQLRADYCAHMRRIALDIVGFEQYTPAATTSAIQLAWKLYGDATRAEEIVLLNAVEHPDFIPGGVELVVARA